MVEEQGRFLYIICIFVCWISVSPAAEQQTLSSENTASLFTEQASEIYSDDPLASERIEQAMTFLQAAYLLDSSAVAIPEQMLRVGAGNCYVGPDYSSNLMWALNRYMGPRSDMEVISGALRCVFERLQSRLDREVFLQNLISQYNGANPAFVSELSTQLGLLVAEKSDIPSAINYLSAAYQLNPYNQLAYSKILELAAGQTNSIPPSVQIAHLRRNLALNPYDLDTAVSYADALQQYQIYDLAAGTYEFAAQTHQFLYPDRPLPKDILHSWLLSCYHSNRMEAACLKIADQYRDPDHFDLVLEAITGKVQMKMSQTDAGTGTLEAAAGRAESLLSSDTVSTEVNPEYLAWFYSFILESPEKALAWSTQAFEQDPNRPGVKAIFGYTLAANGQFELAQEYAEPYQDTDQIALLTMAVIQRSDDRKEQALESLKNVVEMAPETFVAEKATQLLDEQESAYIPTVSPDTMRQELESRYRFELVPAFLKPSERYTVKLLFSGSDFLYGSDFSSRLVIENTSSDPLVISDTGLLKGHLSVDAELEGNLNVTLEDLLVTQFRPSNPILPGENYSVPLNLNRGRLQRILLTYPQADVWIEFHVRLDPQVSSMTENTATTIEARIHRRGIVLSRHFLMQRLDVITKGQTGQKYQAASLFAGLLAEQKAFNLSRADFEHVQVEQELLTDAIRKILADSDWKIRVHALNSLLTLEVPLEGSLIRAVSDNLNHEQWPVRLAAIYLLAKAQPDTFEKVLDWTARNDASIINRKMAIALGASVPDEVDDEAGLKIEE